jgi:uncharacterized protein (UPF0264 family)
VRLLVSVRNAEEARAAVAGGADIVDAKDPARGAMGAVEASALGEIERAVRPSCSFSVALGDAGEAAMAAARAAAEFGADYVKVGFAGVSDSARLPGLIRDICLSVRLDESREVRGERNSTRVIAVAYAEGAAAGMISPREVVTAAAMGGAFGVLLDTALKHGPGLLDLMCGRDVADWIILAHDAGLTAALAGKLDETGVGVARDLGADIAGVRGAACEGPFGRLGRVSIERTRALKVRVLGGPRPTLLEDEIEAVRVG